MCRPATCKTCGKTTWAGCGQHVDQVRRGVPSGQWCNGHESASSGSAPSEGGFFAKLFGR